MPPAIRMMTPSGRFQPGKRLCLSISDYHPETWNPAWSVSAILTGLLSFMMSDEILTGGIKEGPDVKRTYANDSKAWNKKQKDYVQHIRDANNSLKSSLLDIAAAPVKKLTNITASRTNQPNEQKPSSTPIAGAKRPVSSTTTATTATTNNKGPVKRTKFYIDLTD